MRIFIIYYIKCKSYLMLAGSGKSHGFGRKLISIKIVHSGCHVFSEIVIEQILLLITGSVR